MTKDKGSIYLIGNLTGWGVGGGGG